MNFIPFFFNLKMIFSKNKKKRKKKERKKEEKGSIYYNRGKVCLKTIF